MAERVEIIEIETGQSAKTLKELKDEIKDLRKQLDSCEIGSDNFTKTLNELTDAQTELKQATKSSNDALEGSYDSLVQKMGDLKKAWRATADEAERADLGSQIAEINSQLKDMDAEIGNYQRNVGNYGSAFDGVTMKIEGGVARFEKFNNASRAVIGSFDLVEGGLKAIGVESEEVNGLMDKMQGAMMLTNGLNSVKEGVQAFNALRVSVTSAEAAQWALNAAQMANPIGLIVTAVAALIAGITTLVVVMGRNREEEERLKEAYEATNRAIEKRIEVQEFEIELMEARGAAQEDILKQELEYAKLNAQTTKDRIAQLEKQRAKLGWFTGKQKEELDKQINELKEQLVEEEQAVDKANKAIILNDERTKTEQKKKATELANAQIEEARRSKEERLRQEQEYLDGLKSKYEELQNELATWRYTAGEKEAIQIQNQYFERLKFLKEYHKAGLISEEQYLQDKQKLREWYDAKSIEILQKINEETGFEAVVTIQKQSDATVKSLEDTQSKVETLGDTIKNKLGEEKFNKMSASVGFLGTALGQTSQMLTALANNQDKTTKAGFEKSKKLSIAAATMSMLQGIISAWTSAMSLPAPLSFITGGAMSAFTASMGAIQINQIKKQKFEGGNTDSAGAANVPTVNTASLLSTPINYTTEVKGASAMEDATDTRVYVVESDITDTVNKVRTTESESTF